MARTKKMMRKLRYRLNKPKTAIIVKKSNYKKQLLAKRWAKLLKSPRTKELKITFYNAEYTFSRNGAAGNDLLNTFYFQLTDAAMPTQGVFDNSRLGDNINIKSYSINMTIMRQTSTYQNGFLRVIFFKFKTYPSGTSAPNFWRYGSVTPRPALNCMVNKDHYIVLSDKTYKWFPNVIATATDEYPFIRINKRLMANKVYLFDGATQAPAKETDRIFCAVLFTDPIIAATDTANQIYAHTNVTCVFSD